MTGKTLIAYASKSGANSEAANTIADALKTTYNMDITIADLRKEKPDITPFQNIIVGSGVRAGRVYSEAVNFLGNNFGERKVALYFCCGEGGDPKTHDKCISEDTGKALAKNSSLKPIAVEAFGGRMKMLGKVLWDSRDQSKVREWAIALGKQL
jgi:menaquinone-dependent protoporphyrinogen IX oxidase